MCGEATEAIPYLAAARAKLPEPDRVLAEESLVRAYVATGATNRASAVIDEGIARGGPAAARFLALRAELTGGDD
jgi:hypothetical protein